MYCIKTFIRFNEKCTYKLIIRLSKQVIRLIMIKLDNLCIIRKKVDMSKITVNIKFKRHS